MVKIKNKRQKLRFGIVGAFNTALDFGLLLLLRHLGLPAVSANIISSTTAFCSSFVANKTFTFRSSGASLRREILRFTAVTLFGLWVIQSIIIHFSEPLFLHVVSGDSAPLLLAKCLATLASLSWNYYMYDRFVFTSSSEQ